MTPFVIREREGGIMRSGGIKRTALLVAVTLMAAALPSAAFVTATIKPAVATTPSNPGGPFPLHFGDTVSDGMIGGTPTPGAGNLEVRGDEDVYTFTVPTGGTRAIFTVPNGGGLNWSLVDSAGREQFASSNFVSNGPDFLAPGPYRLTVTPIANSAYAGAYTFSMNQMPAPQSFNIALDQVILDGSPAGAGNLESPGASDVYHFTVPSGGAPIYMQSLIGCFCRMWLSQDSTGRLLKSDSSDASFGPMFLAAGNYTMTMRGNTEQTTATYKFKLWRAPEAQVFNFPNFPATPITASNGVPATGAGNLEMTTSADVYTFPLASVPTNVQISLTGNCGHRFTLIAPSGVTVVDKSCSAPVIVRLTEVGTAASPYRLVVSDYANTYSLNVQSTVAAPTVTLTPTKFNITLKSPTAPPASRAVAIPADVPTPLGAGNIETVGARDAYAFTGNAGDEIYVEQATGSMWWNLRLPGGRSQYGTNGTGSDQKIRLPESGTYVLTVFGSNGTPTGAYTLNIWSVPPPERFTSTLAAPNAARQFPADVAGTGAGNLESVGTQDVYTFTTTTPGQRLYLGNATSGAYIYWRLIGPDGREFIGSDYYIGLYNGMGETGAVDLRDAGQYQLLVYGANTYHGAYSFSMWTAEAPQVFAVHLGDTVSNGVPGAGAGHLEGPGAEDVYTFHADAGARVYIQGQYTENTHIRWSLDDAAGVVRSRAYYGYHADGWWFINESGDFNGGSDVLQIHRSGTYKLVVATGDAFGGTYQFKLWSPPIRPPVSLTLGQPVNGNLDVPGVENLYQFHGTSAGQQISITTTGSHPTWVWCVYTFDAFLPCNTHSWSTNPTTVTLTGGGSPLMRVWDYASNKTTGAYTLSASLVGTAAGGAPLTDVFPIAIGDTVDVNSPATGAGDIEVAGANDTYQFDAVSGEAVYFDGTGHCATSALSWNLRDPDGATVFDMPATSLGCQVGPVVLTRTGTYVLSVGGSTAPTVYGFTLRRVDSLHEAANAGEGTGTPLITGIDPATGASGGTTTFDVYGSNLPQITAVHMSRAGGAELPVRLDWSRAVNTSLVGVGGAARVDLTSAPTGSYDVRFDFADGTSQVNPAPFVVTTAVEPKLDISLEYRPLTPATTNYVFVNIRNRSGADYYHATLAIKVPCDTPAETLHHDQYTATVRMRVAHFDQSAVQSYLMANGFSQGDIDVFNSAQVPDLAAPTLDEATGECWLDAYVPMVPSGDAASIKLEIVPPTPPVQHVGGKLGPIQVFTLAEGTHTQVNAPDSAYGVAVNATLQSLGITPPDTSQSFTAASTSTCTGPFCCHGPWCVPVPQPPHIPLPDHVPPIVGLALCELAGIAAALAVTAVAGPRAGAAAGAAAVAACHVRACIEEHGAEKCLHGEPDEPPVDPSHDPNDIFGPRGVKAGDWVDYTIDFENDGVGSAQRVDVRATLDQDVFDLSSFEAKSVRIGDREQPLVGNAALSTATLDANGNTETVRATLLGGDLNVAIMGAPNAFQPLYGDFLPPNSLTNDPAGKGYVRFRVRAKATLALNTVIRQGGTVVFNPHAIGGGDATPTNIWETTVGLLPGQVLSPKGITALMPAGTVKVQWKAPKSTASKPTGAVDSYTIKVWQYEARTLANPFATRKCTIAVEGATTVPVAEVTVVKTKLSTVITMPSTYEHGGYFCFTVTANNALGSGPASKLSSKRRVL
jgi:hypothetical protein